MSTFVGDDIPQTMAVAIARHPDMDEATCVALFAGRSEYLLREIIEHAPEAVAIAAMARNAKRDLEQIKADLEAELRR